MNQLQKRKGTATPTTLDGLFTEIAQYGHLNMFQSKDDGTWSVTVHVPTDNPAIEARVHSGFRHRTPHEAITSAILKIRGEA